MLAQVKSKECEFNILVNQTNMVQIEKETEINKQLRTIAKLRKELKNVQNQIKKTTDDNANVSKFLTNTRLLLDEADVQEADMKA